MFKFDFKKFVTGKKTLKKRGKKGKWGTMSETKVKHMTATKKALRRKACKAKYKKARK